MPKRPDRFCVPLEMEFIPLYREPRGSARLSRELRRARRSGSRVHRMLRFALRGR